MADRGKGKPGGRTTTDAPRMPGMVASFRKAWVRGPALNKAELRAQGHQAMAMATKAIVKLPTKVVRQCGRCGEPSAVMVAPGQATPAFKCKRCDTP